MSEAASIPELDQLGAQLADIEAQAAPAAPGAPEAPAAPADPAQECELLVSFAFDTLAPWYPATCAAWTPEKRAALKTALVPLAGKYGFSLAGMFDKWGPEVGLALVVVPMIGPTMQGLAADKKAPAPAAAPAAPAGLASAAPAATPLHPPPPSTAATPPTPTFNMGGDMVIGG